MARRTERNVLGSRGQRGRRDPERAGSALANHRGTGLPQEWHRLHDRLERSARARGPRVRVARSVGPDLNSQGAASVGSLALARAVADAMDLAGLAPSGSLAPTEWVRLPPGPLERNPVTAGTPASRAPGVAARARVTARARGGATRA